MSDFSDAEIGAEFCRIISSADMIEATCIGCGESHVADMSLALVSFIVEHTKGGSGCGAKGGAMVTLRNAE